MRNEGNSSFTL